VQTKIQEVAKREFVILNKGLPSSSHQLLPVAISHGRMCKVPDQGQRSAHRLEFLLHQAIHLIVAHCLVEGLNVFLKLFGFFREELNINAIPWGLVPLCIQGEAFPMKKLNL
jgi:hypothetical protein